MVGVLGGGVKVNLNGLIEVLMYNVGGKDVCNIGDVVLNFDGCVMGNMGVIVDFVD